MAGPFGAMKRVQRNECRVRQAMQQPSTIVNAAALQDHLARSMTLSMAPLRFRKPSVLPFTPKSTVTVSGYRQVWVCETCTLENDDQLQRCSACASVRSRYGQSSTRPTLAQKRGLVQGPTPKLSRDEWERCEQQAESRGDTVHPCSICRESFGEAQQVILSCSHMFHEACITSFERFLRTNQRVCPLCRKQDYQKKSTHRASGPYRERCAALIQARIRGFLARQRASALWHRFYTAGKGDPMRRRHFLANRVSKATDRLVVAMQQRDDSIDSLLAEFDKSIRFSRQVFQQTDPATDDDHQGHNYKRSHSADDWAAILTRAQMRGESDCAICLNGLLCHTNVTLLSCSHVFHGHCLRSFEDFNIYEIPLCPVCRSSYRSHSWSSSASLPSSSCTH